jgi:ParB family chromosome partitioning protein
MVENLQRQDLDFIEEAMGIARLMELCNLSQEQAARQLGKSQSAIANKLRLLRHSPPVLNALRRYHLTERHARALLKLRDEGEKIRVIEEISQMSVAQAEKYIDSLLRGQDSRARAVNVQTFLNHLQQSLQRIQLSGVAAISERRETEDEITLTITIPK